MSNSIDDKSESKALSKEDRIKKQIELIANALQELDLAEQKRAYMQFTTWTKIDYSPDPETCLKNLSKEQEHHVFVYNPKSKWVEELIAFAKSLGYSVVSKPIPVEQQHGYFNRCPELQIIIKH